MWCESIDCYRSSSWVGQSLATQFNLATQMQGKPLKGPGNVLDGGLACFDINTLVVDGAIWLSQLVEHLVNELVEELRDGRGQ